MFKKILPFILLSLVFLTACGTSSDQTSEKEDIETKYEGTITLYTSQPENDIQKLVKEFNEIYPEVKVSIFRSGTEEVVSKVLAENEVDNILADVLLVADNVTFETLKEEGLLMSYASKELDAIDKTYYDVDNTYTGTKIITTGIVVNTDELNKEEVITSLKDLEKNELKGEVIMPSPLYSGAASYNLSVLLRTEGFGLDYFKALHENDVTVGTGNGSVSQAVLSGEKKVGLIVDYIAIREILKGAPLEFIYPSEGSLSVTEPIAILESTKNEELAKLFVDFVLSETGQTVTAEMGYTPVRNGIVAPDGFKSADELTNLTYDIKTLVDNKEEDKAEFASIFS